MDYCNICNSKMEHVSKYLSISSRSQIEMTKNILKFASSNKILCSFCEEEVVDFLEFYENLQKVDKLLLEFKEKYKNNYFSITDSPTADDEFAEDFENIQKLEEEINSYLELNDVYATLDCLL